MKDVADRALRRRTASARSRTTSRPIGSLTGYRTLRWGRHLDLHHHGPALAIAPRSRAAARRPAPLLERRLPRAVPARRRCESSTRAAPTRAAPPDDDPLRRRERPQLPQGRSRRRPSSAPSRRPGSWSGCAASTRDLEGLGQLGRARSTGARIRRTCRPAWRKPWPGAGYACFGGGGDYGTAYTERAEIYDAVAKAGITGFVTVSGDRHSFWAGLAAKALPPRAVRAGRRRVHHRLGLRAGPGRGVRAPLPEGPPAARALRRRRPAGKPQLDREPAAAPRRALVPRVPAHRRPAGGAPRCRTRTCRRTCRSWTWAGTATRRCASRRTRPSASSSASRGRSSAARAPTAGRCAIASSHRVPLWRKGERPRSSSGSSKATRRRRSSRQARRTASSAVRRDALVGREDALEVQRVGGARRSSGPEPSGRVALAAHLAQQRDRLGQRVLLAVEAGDEAAAADLAARLERAAGAGDVAPRAPGMRSRVERAAEDDAGAAQQAARDELGARRRVERLGRAAPSRLQRPARDARARAGARRARAASAGRRTSRR